MNKFINKEDILNTITAKINEYITELNKNAERHAGFIQENTNMVVYGAEEALDIVKEAVQNLPTEEIIHCKDCKLYKTKYCAIDTWTNDAKFYRVRPDDFCSFVELKDEDM